MKSNGNRSFWIALSACGAFFSGAALYQTFSHIIGLVSNFWASLWLPFVLMELISLTGWVVIGILAIHRFSALEILEFSDAQSPLLRIGGVLLSSGVIATFIAIRFWMIDKGFDALFACLMILWILNLIVAVGIKLTLKCSIPVGFFSGLFIFGVVFIVVARIPQITSYPLSLGWSEASRYYYGSLFFSQELYGMTLPPSIMNPSRSLLQAIPFIIQGLPLWFHRLWQVMLSLGLAALTAILFEKRFKGMETGQRILLGIWFFVYLFQGAVYYYLLICVILVFIGFSENKPLRTFIFVGIASIWAGICRINWFPVPGMIAAALYFIEHPFKKEDHFLKYLMPPLLWVGMGTVIAFSSQAIYIVLTGNSKNLLAFGSSIFSDLLWYRLFPNPSFGLGILLGLLFISLPLFLMAGFNLRLILKKMHALQLVGLTGILLVLFIIGLMTSVKVGGGGDLHSTDAFMIMLPIVVLTICHRILEMKSSEIKRPYFWPTLLSAGAIPLVMLLGAVVPVRYDFVTANREVSIIKQIVEGASAKHARILFITQRELLTFGTIQDVPLIPEYEILTLNEMALSGNEAYLQDFYQNLDLHAYDLIISDYQYGLPKQRRYAFGEENDIWTLRVGRYLTCEYFPFLTFKHDNIQIYLPRYSNPVCP